jgi:hypothetical protein
VAEQYRRKPNTKCVVCSKEIYKRPGVLMQNNGRAFCSQNCYGKSCRKEVPCAVCGKLILGGLNKKTCSRSCSNQYREGIKYKIGRPRDKAHHVRAIKIKLFKELGGICNRCGYNKSEILQVHHKDHNRKNNAIENLELICPNCHYEEHYMENSWVKKIQLSN